ncbi:NAD(P)/FAD-dependent oxidoreductase [Tamlana sp. s12]|uniref:dihydrolipoyl dehydrogenase family protein n=1 Tax=Tamlana sp. s12 TaxID=1630406 RepID=UPI0007FD53D4|nr:NAD(P)/FAD-dependent oxidoreductase [Tamlana sp. s12]OBQ52246.1 pyridine nucleotide-disulfide oxidoreductase [Tamlana sp. s12]QQY82360.1 NAD(P)/FAD-dependent oxidoreductase [Tamlana sp. s12]
MEEFDVFVIGSGVAGRLVAKLCTREGLKVAITDNRAFGGTCANRGCDPKKVILGPTEVFEMASNLHGKGVSVLPELNWEKNQKFKREFTYNVPAGTEGQLNDLGVTLYHQSPKFLDANTLSVEGKTVSAKKIVIATGLVPRVLTFEGANYLNTSDDFLKLKKLPKSMVFIGGGYVGMELAHMAARYGCQVTLIERNDGILKAFDSDLSADLLQVSKALGIKFIFNAEVDSVEKLRKNHRLNYTVDGKSSSLKARIIFNTAGRVPAISELALDKGNVAYSEAGVTVNAYLQNTTNTSVYACGDVSSHSVPLTPLSGMEAKIVADNIINKNQTEIDVHTVPSAVFTLPNLASVGLSEKEAKKQYSNVIVRQDRVGHWYNAKRSNEKSYAYKVLINEDTNEVLGAHILGTNAAETINLFALAIHQKIKVDAIKNMAFVYPTWGSDIKSML